MNKKKVGAVALKCFMCVLAGLINAIGVGLFLVPYEFIDGGMSGISFLISHATSLPMGLFIVFLNLPLFAVGIKKLGKSFVMPSVIAVVSYGVILLLFNWIADKVEITITKQLMLPAIFGGLLSGIGSGLTIRMGGSLDGVEVVAIMISKKIDMPVGKVGLLFNIVIMLAAGFMFNWEHALFSIVAYAIGINAIDYVVSGVDRLKEVKVVTEKGDEVADAITNEFAQGVTVIDAKGHYSKRDKKIIYYMVSRFELPILKNIIMEVDEHAIISICETSEAIGKNIKNRKSPIIPRRKKAKEIEDIIEEAVDITVEVSEDKTLEITNIEAIIDAPIIENDDNDGVEPIDLSTAALADEGEETRE